MGRFFHNNLKVRNMKPSKTILCLLGTNILFILLAVLFRVLHRQTGQSGFMAAYITFLTISYHFIMRLAVGETITLLYQKREFHYDAAWYQPKPFEKKLYKRLNVKKWKLNLITAKPEQFDIRQRSSEELLKNMTQAEVVHEIIMVLSFVPLFLIKWYGAASVFLITSVLACLADSLFVMIQRYNRPRLLRLKQKLEANRKK